MCHDWTVYSTDVYCTLLSNIHSLRWRSELHPQPHFKKSQACVCLNLKIHYHVFEAATEEFGGRITTK